MVPETPNYTSVLLPDKYPQQDLFICDVADAVLKDVMQQLEHPFYSLSKKPETNIREYRHGNHSLKIVPNVLGLPTIYDKDVLIYCISQVMAKVQLGEEVSKRVHINSADLLRFTNRGIAGKDYKALENAILRLAGVTITTNIRTGDEEQVDAFGLIDSASIKRKHGIDGRLLWCQVTLSDWVFNAIRAREVLTLHRDYFRLRKPLERRIYELARKHCGQQTQWRVSLEILLKKSGSQSPEKKFRYLIKDLVANDHLPDYRVEYDEDGDSVVFYNRETMPMNKPKSWDGFLSADVFEKISALNCEIDKYALESEFRTWLANKNIKPRNPDAMFLKFVQSCVKKARA